jgi:alginate O-acetyltransferase complex protein AlgJ
MGPLHRFWERCLIALFVATITIPALATIAGIDRPDAVNENRTLVPLPGLRLDLASLRTFPDSFTKYFEDNFSFRTRLVKWQAALRFRGLRVSPSPTVIAGRDGWLFYADDGAVQDFVDATPFTDEQLENWRQTLEHTRDWLARRGIRYLFVIAPDKHVVYPELMPATVHRLHDGSRTDQLVRYMNAHSDVDVVDLRPALLRERHRDRLYHRTDTHWNDLGAWIGYEQILERLDMPGVAPVPRSGFAEHDVVSAGMDLAGMIGLKDELTEDDLQLLPHQRRRAQVVEPAVPSAHLMDARVVTLHPDRARPRLVMFRDSFASALIPFLSEHFSRAVYLWQYNFDPAIVEAEYPDVVIEEWVGRKLNVQWPYDAVADLNAVASNHLP